MKVKGNHLNLGMNLKINSLLVFRLFQHEFDDITTCEQFQSLLQTNSSITRLHVYAAADKTSLPSFAVHQTIFCQQLKQNAEALRFRAS